MKGLGGLAGCARACGVPIQSVSPRNRPSDLQHEQRISTHLQVEKTWRAGETVDLANVEKKETQFTYAEGDEVRP